MTEDILAELKMILKCMDGEKLNYNKASLLQGVLMQQISSEYAETLHEQGLKPYSQCVRNEKDQTVWYIRTLSSEAYAQIMTPLLQDSFTEFYLEHDEVCVQIVNKEVSTFPKSKLIENFYADNAERIFTIHFLTPTAFKKDGKYHFFPDIYNIYYSLMKRYDSASEKESMMSEDTLEQLASHTNILSYNLHSVNFNLEGIRIPSYMGNIVIKINGPQTMVNFGRLLFLFGNYAGVGIKTAIGMGSIKVTEGRKRAGK